MKKKEFYREIGNIDEDLIQAASNACGKKQRKIVVYRIVGLAACFCLICGGLFFASRKDTVYINETPAPVASKLIVPTDENTEAISMTYQELLAYYGMEQLPEKFGEDLIKMEQSYFVLYEDRAGNVLFDTNILHFSNSDKSKNVSIMMAKAEEIPEASGKEVKQSKIEDVPMVIAVSANNAGYTVYWANLKIEDVSMKIIADGMNEAEFIRLLKELLKSC